MKSNISEIVHDCVLFWGLKQDRWFISLAFLPLFSFLPWITQINWWLVLLLNETFYILSTKHPSGSIPVVNNNSSCGQLLVGVFSGETSLICRKKTKTVSVLYDLEKSWSTPTFSLLGFAFLFSSSIYPLSYCAILEILRKFPHSDPALTETAWLPARG